MVQNINELDLTEEAVKELADIVYLAQNTGVKTTDMNAAYEKVGILGSTIRGGTSSNEARLANDILKKYGYNPGSNTDFYGTKNEPTDLGARLLTEQWKKAPKNKDMIVNDNTANRLWLYQELNKLGVGKDVTKSYIMPRDPSMSVQDVRDAREETYRKYNPSQVGKNRLDIFDFTGDYGDDDVVKPRVRAPQPRPKVPTDVIEVGPGEVAPIDPNVSQTVTQQVAPVTYQDNTVQAIPTQQDTGTFSKPLQTAGLSAVPEQVSYKTQYTGTAGAVPQTLVSTVPGQNATYDPNQIGYQNVYYSNNLGQRIMVSEFNGQPTTYVPPGFTKESSAQGYAEGGDAGSRENEALYTIAKMNGYNGPKTGTALKAFFNSSDALKAKARAIGVAMAKGGAVLYAQEGTDVTTPTEEEETPPAAPLPDNSGGFKEKFAEGVGSTITQTLQPQQGTVEKIQPTTADFIPVDAGATTPIAPYAEAAKVGTVEQAEMPTATPASTVEAVTAEDKVRAETEATEAAQGEVSAEAQVEAAQQTESSVSSLEAAQGEAYLIDNPVQRELQEGELISGAADAEKAAKFTEQIQAATATPSEKATVKGQLDGLMQDFEGGETPAWAAGALRAATAKMAARGLGASSMAGQAVVQAAMESALPIAQADAATQASFEAQNLSNRQQRAMLAAQQRAQFMGQEFDQAFQARVANASKISDIANMNFTAEQQVQLENARAANTMNLANLNNNQAMVMAEAAALANLDMANLNNRQQAAVQNAQSFLEMDMANLSNQQQTSLFKAQQNIQALFTDQAAENAAAQFNATSENQTNQFFANLKSQTSQYNATQTNAMNQFNVNSVNALREFNSGLQQQRDMFNAQNGLVVAQANAQWRQNIATLNTAAQNESNMNFAKTMNALTSTNLDAYWQRERDLMSFAFTSAENAADRLSSVLLEKLSAENKAALADAQGKGTLGAVLLKGALNYMSTGGGKIII